MFSLLDSWFCLIFFVLINLRCSWACKACSTSVKVILDRFFVFSNEAIYASYLSSIVTRIFSTILESVKPLPNNFILLTILNNLFEYSLIVLNYFILCSLNSLLKLNTCMLCIFLSPLYYSLKKFQISLGVLRIMILVRIICETPTNKHDFAFAFFVFLSF